jgi:hypothetical protein
MKAEELKTLLLHPEVDLPGILEGKPGQELGLSLPCAQPSSSGLTCVSGHIPLEVWFLL